jgi:acetolactate synthase-1/2/3 large subunit
VGVCGRLATIPAQRIIGLADLVVMIGTSGSAETATAFGRRAHTIQIDIDPSATIARHPAELLVVGDAGATVQDIDSILAAAEFTAPGFRAGEHADLFGDDAVAADVVDAPWTFRLDVVDPRVAVQRLDRLLPNRSIVVIGGGHFWEFPTTFLNGHRERRFLYSFDFGCIGQALPIAFGAAVARPDRPIVVFEGDSSIFMHIHEFDTISRYRPRILTLIMNDNALGAEYHKLAPLGFDPRIAQLGQVAFAEIAQAFGAPAGTVSSLDDLQREIGLFTAGEGPRFVDIHTPVEVVARSRRRTFGDRARLDAQRPDA